MSDEELQQMDKEQLLGIIKAQRFEISILKDDKEHLGEFLKEKDEEIEILNNQIKEYGDLDNHNKYLYEENKRLNNIINELEHHLYQEWLEWKDSDCESIYVRAFEDKAIYDYIQELKGSEKSER